RRIWPRLIWSLLVILIAGVAAIAFWPASADFHGDESTAGVGPGAGGLERAFPAMIVRTDNDLSNPAFKHRVELGRLLYFDPILSGNNDISCATCHHPDLGFTDGRGLGMGKGGHGLGPVRTGGETLRRGAPTIWNACYNKRQFWDGRAADLEEQAVGPITTDNEMGSKPEEVVAKLQRIPEYASMFDSAFKGTQGSTISMATITEAIAAFERTITANNSPFDRFVAGDATALTAQQQRGFNLFRSGKTRCFECHGLPTFNNPDFKVIGVPDLEGQKPDLGRAEIAGGDGYQRAFKVPTLRNVALTAPYMHNGRFKTLDEVLDFYSHGGGPGMRVPTPNVDDKIRPYALTAQEKDDLIAFLCSLTDESNMPVFPDKVPSGLSIVPHLDNPGRALAAKYNVQPAVQQTAAGNQPPVTIHVDAGQSIQAAVDKARPGDIIEISPGIYREQIIVNINNLTMRGIFKADRPAGGPGAPFNAATDEPPTHPVIEGDKKLSDAVIVSGNDFRIEGFEVRHFTGNGIAVQNGYRPVFRNLITDDTGRYGVYPVSCTGVSIENVTVTRVADAGLYVGQSRDIAVRNCEAHDNVTGIEIENSMNSVVEGNYVHDNAGGILVFVLPNNPSKVGLNCKVIGNRVLNNNHENFADPTAIVHNVPPGTGVMIMAADHTEVTSNEIRGNDCYGVAVFALADVFPKGTVFDVGSIPEYNYVHANRYSDNGRHPAGILAQNGMPGADLIWDVSGWSNLWDEPGATRSSMLPGSSWPAPLRRGWWRILSIARDHL
ncbi:MAG TPA: parallel beta-helix domain-containing protein, partial [Blastocatellia bacterium]